MIKSNNVFSLDEYLRIVNKPLNSISIDVGDYAVAIYHEESEVSQINKALKTYTYGSCNFSDSRPLRFYPMEDIMVPIKENVDVVFVKLEENQHFPSRHYWFECPEGFRGDTYEAR